MRSAIDQALYEELALHKFAQLAADGAVVEDGDWFDRFGRRLLNQDRNAAIRVGREAVLDHEVCDPTGVLETLYLCNAVHRSAVASALREVWLDHGLVAGPAVIQLFRDMDEERAALMTGKEIDHFKGLPSHLTVYRGQLYPDGGIASGLSWTLDARIAGLYAAKTSRFPHGWVLEARVSRSAVLALFLERGESEVVLDLSKLPRGIKARRGTCKRFPRHLALAREGGAT